MSGLAAAFQTAFTERVGATTVPKIVDGKATGETETVGGTQVTFARLEVGRDLAVIAQTVIDRRKGQAKDLFSETNAAALAAKLPVMGSFDLFSILQKIQDEDPTIQELYARSSTAPGATAILKQSLTVAGKTPDEADTIIKTMDAEETLTIARALITCRQPKPEAVAKPAEETPPLPSTPDSSGVSVPPAQKIGTATVPAAYPSPPVAT